MGMQVHWDIVDVPDYAKIEYDFSEDTAYIRIEGFNEVSVRDYAKGCWFDCGSCSDWSMDMIQWLIKNRIPFNVS